MAVGVRSRSKATDAGFSLAELGVYMMLSVVALAIVATIFIISLTVRAQVTDLNRSASVGQLIASSVEEGVRNASGAVGETDPARLKGIKAELPTATGQLLRARVAVGAIDGTIQWQCQAWFYSSETAAVYTASDNAAIIEDPLGFSVVNSIHTPTAGSANWILLGEGIGLPTDIVAFFGAGPNGDRVTLYFEVSSENVSLVLIPSTVVKRTLSAGGTGPTTCY